jgi:hypothetical protein
MTHLLFYRQDFQKFQKWLGLKLNDVTWQGKYAKEFQDFWDLFFCDGLALDALAERFAYAKNHAKIGPLYSWFNWIEEKFICFCYLEKDLSILELATLSQKNVSYIGYVIRNFFVIKSPNQEEKISDFFQISNLTNPHSHLKFSELEQIFSFHNLATGSEEDEIMISLEITLYPEWQKFYVRLQKELSDKEFRFDKLLLKETLKKQSLFLKELSVVLVIGLSLITVVHLLNKFYEQQLANKIGLFELDFLWLDKTVSFKERTEKVEKIEYNLKDLDDLAILETKEDELLYLEPEREGVESEVQITSLEAIPKDFGGVGLEQSEYEELTKGGYRYSPGGTGRKAYRVLMKTVEPVDIRSQLVSMLDKYSIEKLGNVNPGIEVPGGIYFNLAVPINNLHDFLTEVSGLDETVIYESESRGAIPPGKNKVFVWVKKI